MDERGTWEGGQMEQEKMGRGERKRNGKNKK